MRNAQAKHQYPDIIRNTAVAINPETRCNVALLIYSGPRQLSVSIYLRIFNARRVEFSYETMVDSR